MRRDSSRVATAMTPIVWPAERIGKIPKERAPMRTNRSRDALSGSRRTSVTIIGCPVSSTRNEYVGFSGESGMFPANSSSRVPP